MGWALSSIKSKLLPNFPQNNLDSRIRYLLSVHFIIPSCNGKKVYVVEAFQNDVRIFHGSIILVRKLFTHVFRWDLKYAIIRLNIGLFNLSYSLKNFILWSQSPDRKRWISKDKSFPIVSTSIRMIYHQANLVLVK